MRDGKSSRGTSIWPRSHGLTVRARVRSLADTCGRRTGSRWPPGGGIREFVAIDQDAESVQQILREQPTVTALRGSVKDVLRGSLTFDVLDFAYAAGLYDDLPDEVAARLTGAMLGMLRPGGKLLVVNFCPDVPDRGYMESCMGWRLIYRDEADLLGLVAELPLARGGPCRVFRDEPGNVVYLELARA